MLQNPAKLSKIIVAFLLLAVILVVEVGLISYRSSQPVSPIAMTTTVVLITTVTITSTALTASPTRLQQMIDFTLPIVGKDGLTGQTLTLSDFKGKVIVLEFMQPWCPHCQRMAPVMEELYRKYSDRVVFTSVGGADLKPEEVADFIRNFNSSLTYLYDSSGAAFKLYGVTSIPRIFVISKDGNIAVAFSGETPYETLAATIDEQLA